MAKGRKTGGRDFQKGNTYGAGRPSWGITEARKLNKEVCEEILNEMMAKSQLELVEYVENKNNPSLHIMIANIVLKGIEYGDPYRCNFLFDRLIGKVKENVEHSGAVTLEGLIAQSFGKKEE